MKLTDLAATMSATNPRYKDVPTDEIVNDLYSQQSQRLREARDELKRIKPSKDSPRPNVNLIMSTDGNLSIKKNLLLEGTQYGTQEELMKSETLAELANLLRPLIGVAAAVLKAGKILPNQELHALDSDGKRTNQTLKDHKGSTLYNVDPLSQVKILSGILESNPETSKALKTIGAVLKQYDASRLREANVTREVISAKGPVKVSFRDQVPMDKLESLKPQTQKGPGM